MNETVSLTWNGNTLGSATASDRAFTWTVTESAGTGDLTVTVGGVSDTVSGITVESGAITTAYQFGSSDSDGSQTLGDVRITDGFLYGGNIIVTGETTSSEVLDNAVDNYGSGTSTKSFVCSLTKTYELNWINFYEWNTSPQQSVRTVEYNGSIYTLGLDSSNQGYIYKIDPTDGTQTSRALTNAGGISRCRSMGVYNSKLYVGGDANSQASIWEVLSDLSSDTWNVVSGAGYIIGGIIIDGVYYYANGAVSSLRKIDLSTGFSVEADGESGTVISAGNVYASSTRLLQLSCSATATRFFMHPKTNLGSDIYVQTYYGSSDGTAVGIAKYYDGKFVVFYNDKSDFTLAYINDSDTYTETNITTITPNTETDISTYGSALDCDGTHFLVGGSIKGNIESGYTPEDATKWELFLKLVEV